MLFCFLFSNLLYNKVYKKTGEIIKMLLLVIIGKVKKLCLTMMSKCKTETASSLTLLAETEWRSHCEGTVFVPVSTSYFVIARRTKSDAAISLFVFAST
jgi:hypothetical protein